MSNLSNFSHDGIEIYINTDTGESFASVSGYARIAGKAKSTISERLQTVRKNSPGNAEVVTATGLKTVRLVDEDTISEWLPKDNPEMATKLLKLGVRGFLHKLAGYEVSSSAVKPNSLTQAEMLLMYAQQHVENERRLLQLETSRQEHCDRLQAIEAEQERYNYPSGHNYSIMGFANLQGIKITGPPGS